MKKVGAYGHGQGSIEKLGLNPRKILLFFRLFMYNAYSAVDNIIFYSYNYT